MLDNIQTTAIVILVASLAAVLSSRLNQLPMVGYVVAGLLIGPHVTGLVSGEEEVRSLAELGVILLLFVVGIELSLEAFGRSYRTAIPITLLLLAACMCLSVSASFLFGWSFAESLVYGFVISLSSTAVAVKLLKQLNLMSETAGQVALSVLITQDLIFVPMIITINTFGGESTLDTLFFLKLAVALASTGGLFWFLSSRPRVHLLYEKWVEKHDELIPVAALAWCFVGASLSELAGLSPAFGAFLGGIIIGNSHSKDIIFPKIEPMQSVLLMVFFVSIGMLINLNVLRESLGTILFLVLTAMVLKTAFSLVLLRIFGVNIGWRQRYGVALAISQIGEFSFVLASASFSRGVVSVHRYQLLVAVIALSLALSPLWSLVMQRLVPRKERVN